MWTNISVDKYECEEIILKFELVEILVWMRRKGNMTEGKYVLRKYVLGEMGS